ncbi:hypothetical protein C8Q79DRAFT_1007173 [Trametes meyenii]|nr:hypothetical protein C8Q79DRAFT_1007173 [Trametes meyenii]
MASSSSALVDDTDPRVQYQPGWIWDQGVAEVDATRHGAGTTGLTAWLTFTGTGVRVVGTLGPSSTYGQPSTTYSIDGQVVGTYDAPFTADGATRYNVTFFSSGTLSEGSHVIRINNTNGTTPNVFWLDYFLIGSAPPSSSTSGTLSPSSPTSSESSTALASHLPASTTDASSSSRSSRSNIGAIVGGTVGGIVALGALVVLLFCLSRRRRRRAVSEVDPYSQQQPASPGTSTSDIDPSKYTSRSFTDYSASASLSPVSAGGTQSPALPPSESVPRSVISPPSTFATRSSVSTQPLTPARPATSPTTPYASTALLSTPSTEKSGSTDPGATSAPSSSATSSVLPTPVSATFSATALVTPTAAPPPGIWHAPPGTHSRAQSLIRSFFSRAPQPGSEAAGVPVVREADSGVRLYDDVLLPPPYTQE